MNRTAKKRPAVRRPARKRSRSNTFVRFINSSIANVRKWFLRRSYAPAVCLGAATVIALTIVCVFALPMPKSAKVESPVTEVVAARTEVPAEVHTNETNDSLYEGLKTTVSGGQESAVIYDKEESAGNVTVYAAEDAECYHLGDCKFAFASSKRLTPYEAYYLHYRPCGRCNPPVYNPVTGLTS